MPIAFISFKLTFAFFLISFVALTTCSHQVSGCCSAHPGFFAIICNSVFGEVPEAIILPLSVSKSVALTEELPIS